MKWKVKMREWLSRYWFPELAAFIMNLVVANASMFFFDNKIVAAFLATWLGNFAFYGIIVYRDMRRRMNKAHFLAFNKGISASKKKIFWVRLWIYQVRDLFIEFGPAEYLDSFLLRPFFLASLPYFISPYTLAISIATILANITYYVPVILGYEARKKIFK